MILRKLSLSSCLTLAICAAACDRKAEVTPTAAPTAQTAKVELPPNLITAQPIAEAKSVAEVRKSANDGDVVVVSGRIAGQKQPFTDGRAQFQLIEASIKSCDEMGDQCPTPWDMCCEDKQNITSNSVTVQVVDAQGQPIKAGLEGVGGLKTLSTVSAKGTVKKSPDGKAMVVNATELHVK
jgi:hypothetical protein